MEGANMSGQLNGAHLAWAAKFTGVAALARQPEGPDAAPAQGSADPRAAAGPAFAKVRTAWLTARQHVESELEKLHKAIMTAYKGHGAIGDIDKSVRAKVEPVLDNLDKSLAQKLDDVTKNTDPGQHTKFVGDAKQIIERYMTYVANEPFIAAVDKNPFVPLSVGATLTRTLSALEKSIV